jgi:hypothetical protein
MNNDWDEYFIKFMLFLQKNGYSINWSYLIFNINLSMNMVDKYNYLPFEWDNLRNHPNLTIHILYKYRDKINFSSEFDYTLALNKDTTIDIIDNNPNLNMLGISLNPNITPEYINKHLDKYWDWGYLPNNPNMTKEFIEQHIDKFWYWNILCRQSYITLDFIEKYINRIGDNDWYYISDNLNITIDFIIKYLNKKWNWYNISKHKNITIDIINKYNYLPWDWNYISLNPNITIDIIKKYPFYPWNWINITKNINITMDIIKENINLNWDKYSIYHNSNITFKYIIGNLNNRWNDIYNIAENTFDIQRKNFYKYKFLLCIFTLPNDIYYNIFKFY